jgi:SAM-dependent methyltransferase
MAVYAAIYWDDVADPWRKERLHRLWRAHSDAVNIDLLRRWLPDRHVDRLLKTDLFDEVCGDGLFPILSTHARRVFGIDLSAAAAEAALRRHPSLGSTSADVRSLPFADGTFDVIVSNSTLDHFDHADAIFQSVLELSRVLKSGGELILTLDNPHNPFIAVRNSLPFGLLKRLHLTPYFVGATCSIAQLRQIVAKAGLKELDATAVMHCPRVLGVAASQVLERLAPPHWKPHCLAVLKRFEGLEQFRSRFLTGHFVAVKAQKP